MNMISFPHLLLEYQIYQVFKIDVNKTPLNQTEFYKTLKIKGNEVLKIFSQKKWIQFLLLLFKKSMLQSFFDNSVKQRYWKTVMILLAFGHFYNFNLRREKSQNNKYIFTASKGTIAFTWVIFSLSRKSKTL